METNTLHQTVTEKRAIFFDLFHTLTGLESRWSNQPSTSELLGVDREAWNEQLLEKSRERLAGDEKDPFTIMRGLAHAIDPSIPLNLLREVTETRMQRFAGTVINIPPENLDVLRVLRAQGKKLGLISNADVTEIAAWDRSPLAECFDSVILSCHVGCVKPEKEIYELAMRELDVQADESIFVGDGSCDELAGAQSVGMTTVMITGVIKELWPARIEQRRPHADYVIDKLSELLPSSC